MLQVLRSSTIMQVNRAVLRRAIERGGFDAVETSTGAEAVLAFQNQGEDGGFLCVLMVSVPSQVQLAGLKDTCNEHVKPSKTQHGEQDIS